MLMEDHAFTWSWDYFEDHDELHFRAMEWSTSTGITTKNQESKTIFLRESQRSK
jgi:hypothetical protein